MPGSWLPSLPSENSSPSVQTSTPGRVSPFRLLPSDVSDIEQITDENSLSQYLKDYENYEKTNNLSGTPTQTSNLLSSFWSHPSTKSTKDTVAFLRNNTYQLSTQSPGKLKVNKSKHFDVIINIAGYNRKKTKTFAVGSSSSSSPGSKLDYKGSPLQIKIQGMEMWKRLGVDTTTLTLWNENLRLVRNSAIYV